MTSRNKMRKAKRSYCANALKFGKSRLKRLFFFDATQRKRNKRSIVFIGNSCNKIYQSLWKP
jgi:hypothetical protein